MKTVPVTSQEFIGRDQELSDIRRPIERAGRRYLISIHGRGGVGKTSILKKLYTDYARRGQILCFPVIDFSQSKTRTRRWLMDFIAGQAFDSFPQYHELAEARAPKTSLQAPTQVDLEEAFFADFQSCEQQTRCLFLFDTLELIQDTLLLDFLLDMISKAGNSVIVLAGRRNDELEVRFLKAVGASSFVPISLSGFSEEDALNYMRQHAEGADLSLEEQQVLYLLAEEGVPIKLALALDWLSRGFVMNTLADYSLADLQLTRQRNIPDFQAIIADFEHELVAQIGQLGTDVDQAIHIMAHVHKRFNRELLELTLPQAVSDELLRQIKSLPFVKSIEEDYFVLHDEIQRMVVKHVWDWDDPGSEKRRELSAKVIGYYDRKLKELAEQARLQGEPATARAWEYRIYEIERLHYQLDINLIESYYQFMKIFEELEDRRDRGDIELAALALEVLTKNRPLPPRLRAFVTTYYYGWILVRRKYLEQARDHIELHLHELIGSRTGADTVEQQPFLESEVEQRLGEVYTLHGYCHRLLGDWETAIELYERGRKFNEALIDRLQHHEHHNAELVKRSVSRLAETLNDIANLQRLQGELGAARRYCKVSLLIRQGLREDRAVGHCCYVMATVMWELGNTSEAMNYLQQARRYYQKTGAELLERAWIDRYLGFVMYRTGNIQEALRLLNHALDATSSSRTYADEHAETLITLSRIHRDQSTPERRQQALREAQAALQIAKEVPNDYRIAECFWIICLVLWDMLRDDPTNDMLRAQLDENYAAGLELSQRRRYRRLEAAFIEINADREFERKDYISAFKKYGWVCHRATEFKPAVFVRAMSKLADRLYQLVREHPKQTVSVCDRLRAEWGENDNADDNTQEFLNEVAYIDRVAQSEIRRQELDRAFEKNFHTGAWKESLDICDQSDAIAIAMHPERASVLHRRAEVYHSGNSFSLARLYCERAIRIRRAYASTSASLGDSYLLCSRIAWKLGATAESADYLQHAYEEYQGADADVGLGLVELERAYFYFRTHQFDQISERLARAQNIFKQANEPLHLASTLNLLSRVARVDPRQLAGHEEIAYQEARRHGEEALQVLGDKDWFIAAEINLTLCILHYNWGRLLVRQGHAQIAQEHFAAARQHTTDGWKKIEHMNSPMLLSVFCGLQANLFLQAGKVKEALQYFLDELAHATQTKHMRLFRALDLLEDWLVSEPPDAAQRHASWLIDNWRARGLSAKYPQVEESLQWLLDHRRYIFQDHAPSAK